MGVRLPSVATKVIANAAVVTTTELQVVVTPPLNIALDFAQVLLFWYIALTVGAGTTAVAARLRRGVDVTGSQLTTFANVTVAANSALYLNGSYSDIPGAVAGVQYCVCILQTGATGNAAITDVSMIALML